MQTSAKHYSTLKKNKNISNNHDYTETLLRICTFLLGYFFFGHSAEVVVGRIPNSSVLWSISNIFRKYGVEHIMFRNSIQEQSFEVNDSKSLCSSGTTMRRINYDGGLFCARNTLLQILSKNRHKTNAYQEPKHLLPQNTDLLLFLFGLMCKWGKNFD